MCVCVYDVCSCVWLWAYSYEAHVWRSESSLKNQSITHLTPCLRRGLSFPLSVQGQLATTSKDPSTIISYLGAGILGLEMCATSGFLCVLGIKDSGPFALGQALYSVSNFPSP